MDEYLEIDLGELRIREIEELEELTGRPFDGLFTDDSAPKGKVMRAIGYLVKRRQNPEFTWEQAGELKIRVNAEPTKVDPTVEGD